MSSSYIFLYRGQIGTGTQAKLALPPRPNWHWYPGQIVTTPQAKLSLPPRPNWHWYPGQNVRGLKQKHLTKTSAPHMVLNMENEFKSLVGEHLAFVEVEDNVVIFNKKPEGAVLLTEPSNPSDSTAYPYLHSVEGDLSNLVGEVLSADVWYYYEDNEFGVECYWSCFKVATKLGFVVFKFCAEIGV